MGLSLKEIFNGQGILGGGLSWEDQHLRICLTRQEEESFRVLALREAVLEKPEPKKIQNLLKKWQVPRRTQFGLSLLETEFKLQKIDLPTGEEENAEGLLNEKLQEALEGSATTLQEWDFRLMPLEVEEESGDSQSYLVYLMRQASLRTQRRMARNSGLSIKVGESAALSAAAWLDILLESPKDAALIYFSAQHLHWVGLKQGQVQFYTSLPLQNPISTKEDKHEAEDQDKADQQEESWSLQLPQVFEDYLLSSGLEELEYLYLGGPYEAKDKQQIIQCINLPLKDISEINNPWVLFEEDASPSLSGRFAAELGISLFPRRAI